ncbi:hypothetical protein [Sphingomonas sp. Leaf412]|uniref:hypothetical protein n=1 Tax=Sphingomonas sp. Leaf412 TaxID=1736370 RepID=UPI0012E38D75|nr:hypothetical protein [Sphingomonas sp. Leaf412]
MKALMANIHASFSALIILSLSTMARAQDRPKFAVPPPPVEAPEFMIATDVSHTVDARCAGYRMNMAWRSGENGTIVTGIEFGNEKGTASEIGKINSWIKGLPGDVLVRVECNVEGALLGFFSARPLGTIRTKMVEVSWLSGKATLIDRYDM